MVGICFFVVIRNAPFIIEKQLYVDFILNWYAYHFKVIKCLNFITGKSMEKFHKCKICFFVYLSLSVVCMH